MPLGNWRQVILSGPYAVKTPRAEPDRTPGARCLNRWEHEMWAVWRVRFNWEHLCPVVWADPGGHVLVMQRARQDVSAAEIQAFETAWMSSAFEGRPMPDAESKTEDWGRLDDGRLVVVDYGYACDTEDAMRQQREYYTSQLARLGL